MRAFVVLFLLLAAACAPATRPLHPLDAAHAGDLRGAFDGARDRQRLVVALSPT